MRSAFALALLALPLSVLLAQTPMPRTHTEIVQFVASSGLSVCDSVANEPPAQAKAQGAIGKHLIEVAADCERKDAKNPNVIFAFEFDTGEHRDAAVAGFVKAFEASFVDYASAWAIGERGAVFVSGPGREAIRAALQAEYERRAKAAAG